MESLQNIFMSFINVIPMLVQVGICGYYLARSRTPDAVLLLIGSGIHLLTAILYNILFPILVRNAGFQSVQMYYTVGGIIGFIGTIAFLIGLFLLIQKRLEPQEPTKPW